MKASVIALSGFVACALALPSLTSRQTSVCSEGTPQCCDVNVLGLADLDCSTREYPLS